ncbi:MAG TPA: mycofactocin-coupled SDR family oxidoreductase [Acidimicrobiales bacterium]|nr:mycofactocin-coupled SDR family oxidoreductase [Acidimicrobiales bacterium]
MSGAPAGPVRDPAPVGLITGAGRGVGAATARQLAAEGWRLVLVDACTDDPALGYPLASWDDLVAVADACGPTGAVPVVGDVRRQGDLDAAVATARERFGGLDAAVAVAGAIAGGLEAWRTDDDLWAAMVGINLEGVWHLARAAVPALLERPDPRRCRFVAVGSAAGVQGLPGLGAYVAAKHGVVGLVRALAAELGPHGVTANVVAPGTTATAMARASAALYGLEDPSELAVHHRLPRLVAPEEVAALLAWVCGPQSSAVTGAVLPVDAGMTSG